MTRSPITSPMALDSVHSDLRKAFRRVPKMNLESAFSRLAMSGLVKLLTVGKRATDVSITLQKLGPAAARIYTPVGPRSGAGLLWIHGGGMVLGSASMNDQECAEYTRDLGAVVVSVEYRLAPKHPYPAAIDDCYAVWCWFRDNAARFGVAPKRIGIAGQSAGGGLAAALCQRILDTGGEQPAAQCLYYPMLDDRTAVNDALTPIDHLGWNNRNNCYGWSAYLGKPAGSRSVPQWSSPGRRRNLGGLPPAWIGVGELDLFLEENKSYAARLQQADVSVDLHLVEKAPHGFDAVARDAQISREFVASARTFLKKHLQT